MKLKRRNFLLFLTGGAGAIAAGALFSHRRKLSMPFSRPGVLFNFKGSILLNTAGITSTEQVEQYRTYEVVDDLVLPQGYTYAVVAAWRDRIIGSFSNCAGGTTPWGTVLSAEENFQTQVPESVYAEDDAQVEQLKQQYATLGKLYTGDALTQQGAILIDAHYAANAIGATCAARPEDTVIAADGSLYISFTSGSAGEEGEPDQRFTLDQQTMFLSIQHPGEINGIRQNQASETRRFTLTTTTGQKFEQTRTVPIGSNWHSKSPNAFPKPTVVAIQNSR